MSMEENKEAYVHQHRGTFIPRYSQLDMGVVASVDSTFHHAHVQSALLDVGVEKELSGNSHSNGSKPALD